MILMVSAVTFSQNAPVTFEPGEPGSNWTWTTFENVDNAPLEIIPNPDQTGNNTSPTVAKFIAQQDGAPFAGFESQHGSDIGTFTLTAENSSIKLMVWKSVISDVGIKLVTSTNASTGEIRVSNTLVNQWEELTFDFSGKIGETNDQLVIFPDFQNNRTSDNVCYIDNLTFGVPVINPLLPTIPVDFESDILLYNFVNFGGAETTKVSNPNPGGINESAHVSQQIKTSGAETWGGSYINLGTAIDFSESQSISIKTWSPQQGGIVKLKLENSGNPNINIEVDAPTTVANAWEKLTFNFPESVIQNTYQRIVLFFDFGNPGNGSTFYFDDIILESPLSLNDFSKNDFKLYPNPAGDYLTISAASAMDDITIYSVTGQVLRNVQPFDKEISLDVSDLSNGIYMIRTIRNGIVQTKKFTKK